MEAAPSGFKRGQSPAGTDPLDQRMSKLSALSNSVSLMINNLYA